MHMTYHTKEIEMAIMIMVPVGLIMICIGYHQYRSEKPATFWSGETPPDPEKVRDIRAWNHKHGSMWMIYGLIIIAGWYISSCMGDVPEAAIPLIGGVVVPLPLMVLRHKLLEKKYIIR